MKIIHSLQFGRNLEKNEAAIYPCNAIYRGGAIKVSSISFKTKYSVSSKEFQINSEYRLNQLNTPFME